MKFSKIVVFALVAPVASAFTVPTTSLRYFRSEQKNSNNLRMSLDDLESKLLGKIVAPPAPVVPEPPVPAPVVAEKPKPKPKVKPTPPPKPEPKVAKAPEVKKPEPKKPAPAPKREVVAKAAPKPTTSSGPGTLAAGVALGAAPLALAGLGALAAGRSVLSSTLERREKIQKEIEQAKKVKIERQTEIDAGGVTTALVRDSDASL